jgi:prepilin-type N-terminal cleavage/methylation domain-containing protein
MSKGKYFCAKNKITKNKQTETALCFRSFAPSRYVQENILPPTQHCNIKAFTLVELLIVMIIAGIILLSITEGFSMLQRLIVNKHSQITKNMDIYDAYYRLESVIYNSDSVAAEENSHLIFYSNGIYRSTIYKDDIFLIINFANANDTVLQNIYSLDLIQSGFYHISDTVAIHIAYNDKATVCWKFTVPVIEEKVFAVTVEDNEKDYVYD